MPTDEHMGGEAWAVVLLALAFSGSGVRLRDDWVRAAKEACRAEEERAQFRHYSEDCPSLDEHPDGNAYERLCTDPGHPYHRDSRPQCDRDLCPHLHPNRNPFRGCCGCQ